MTKLSVTLKTLMAEDKLNTTDLSRATGILQPVMHRMVVGDTDNPRVQTLLPIAKHFNITVEQLMGEAPLPSNRISPATSTFIQTWKHVPLLESWHDISKHINKADISDYDTIETNVDLGDRAYALKVKDSTMVPRFMENSILIIDPSLTPENGDFVIAQTVENNEPTFKQVFFDSGDIYLKPLNTEFKTIVLDKDTTLTFLGVVVVHKSILKTKHKD